MARDIITSIHGNLIGLGATGELILNNASQNGLQTIRGSYRTTISNAQVLALNATPQSVVPAPGAGNLLVVERWGVYKAAGTAFAGIAAGEDLVLKYTNGSGTVAAAPIETTGFLDQATAQIRYANGSATGDGATPATMIPVENAALVAQLLAGEITTGTSALVVAVWFAIVPSTL